MQEIQKYFDHKLKLEDLILEYLDNFGLYEAFDNLVDYIKSENILNIQQEFKYFLGLLVNIFNYHHRIPGFVDNFEKILLYFKNEIKQTFSNSEIVNIFLSSKFLLLFLIKQEIILFDDFFLNSILVKCEANGVPYCYFFIPEIEKMDSEYTIAEIANFDPRIHGNYEEKREQGENDSYLCTLIRNDSAREFISYVTQNNISLTMVIDPSIFETHSFLNENKVTLFEYAAFFGSLKIFNFILNKIELSESIYKYAIHSNNANLVHIIEDIGNNVDLIQLVKNTLIEAIKCHHNNLVSYISNWVDDQTNDHLKEDKLYIERIVDTSFLYQNYFCINLEYAFHRLFFNLCKFDYIDFVNLLLKTYKNDIDSYIIFKLNFHRISIELNSI